MTFAVRFDGKQKILCCNLKINTKFILEPINTLTYTETVLI